MLGGQQQRLGLGIGLRRALADLTQYLVQAGELELVSNPVQFDVAAPQTAAAPGFAEQTDEILEQLGLDWDRIIELKTAGAVT